MVAPGNAEQYAVGSDSTLPATVRVFDGATSDLLATYQPYGMTFRGSVSVATADVSGDGVDDTITGAGNGGGPHVKVFNGANGQIVRQFMAYDPDFRGGVVVAGADVTGDGIADVITGAGKGGGPHVKVFDGATGLLVSEFMAYETAFRGGVTLAAVDVTGDGRAEIVTGTGAGGGPLVRVFDGATATLIREFMAYDPSLRGGVFVAAADARDGTTTIVTGAGGGGPHVKLFDGATGTSIRDFFPFDPGLRGGIGVAVTRGDDGRFDVLTGVGGGSQLRRLDQFGTLQDERSPFDPTYQGGLYIG